MGRPVGEGVVLMNGEALYIILFIARAVILSVMLHKYGWKAFLMAWAFAVCTDVSSGLQGGW